MIQQKTIYIGIGLILAIILVAIVGALLSDLPRLYRLSKNGIETQGKIISKERENHKSIIFEYEADNRKFKKAGHVENIGKSFDSVQLNENVSVFYNPAAPEESCLCNPDEQLSSGIEETSVVSIIPILLFLSYLIQKKIKKKSENQE